MIVMVKRFLRLWKSSRRRLNGKPEVGPCGIVCSIMWVIRNRTCTLRMPIRNRPCILGRPIRNLTCILGGTILNYCLEKCCFRNAEPHSGFKHKQTNVLKVDHLVSARCKTLRPRCKTAVGSKQAESNDARRSSS